jgi:hypothetical protein
VDSNEERPGLGGKCASSFHYPLKSVVKWSGQSGLFPCVTENEELLQIPTFMTGTKRLRLSANLPNQDRTLCVHIDSIRIHTAS